MFAGWHRSLLLYARTSAVILMKNDRYIGYVTHVRRSMCSSSNETDLGSVLLCKLYLFKAMLNPLQQFSNNALTRPDSPGSAYLDECRARQGIILAILSLVVFSVLKLILSLDKKHVPRS